MVVGNLFYRCNITDNYTPKVIQINALLVQIKQMPEQVD